MATEQFNAKVVYKSYSGGAINVVLTTFPVAPTRSLQLTTLGVPGTGVFNVWSSVLFCTVPVCQSLTLNEHVEVVWERNSLVISSFEIIEGGSMNLASMSLEDADKKVLSPG